MFGRNTTERATHMPLFKPDIKHWRKFRPEDCKKSGIADAIKKYNKYIALNEQKRAKGDPEGNIIKRLSDDLLDAIKEAQKKLSRSNGDAGNIRTVQRLIADWAIDTNGQLEQVKREIDSIINAAIEQLNRQFETEIRNKKFIKIFYKFAKTEFSDESVEFIIEVDKKKPAFIIAKYINDDAPRMINLSDRVRQEALGGNFNTAKQAIISLLRYDTLSRFKKTDECRDYVIKYIL